MAVFLRIPQSAAVANVEYPPLSDGAWGTWTYIDSNNSSLLGSGPWYTLGSYIATATKIGVAAAFQSFDQWVADNWENTNYVGDYSGWSSTRLLDGSSVRGEWVQLRLPRPILPTGVRARVWGAATVLVSENGTTFQRAGELPYAADVQTHTTTLTASAPCHYIRLVVTKGNSSAQARLQGVKIYGTVPETVASSTYALTMPPRGLLHLRLLAINGGQLSLSWDADLLLTVAMANNVTTFTLSCGALTTTTTATFTHLAWHTLGVRTWGHGGRVDVLWNGILRANLSQAAEQGPGQVVLSALSSTPVLVDQPVVQPVLHVPAFLDCSQSLRVATTLYCGHNLAVATSRPAYQVDVSGTIRATSDVIVTSDARQKRDIMPIDRPLDRLQGLHGYTFGLRAALGSRHTGLVAQEVANVLPEAVAMDQHGTLCLAYGNIVGLLVEAIKALDQRLERLDQGVASLRRAGSRLFFPEH